MSNYTPEEVQAAVSKIVRSTVSHPTGALGNRDTSATFNELQEAAAGVFVLYYNAPFYCIKLGTTRVADSVQAQAQTVSDLIDAVKACSKLTTPLTDISALANANSALQALGSAVGNRKDGFQDITQVPAYQRYAASISLFIQQGGDNIKSAPSTIDPLTGSPTGGVPTSSVIDTPAGARAKIPGLVTALQSQHQALIASAGLLAGAMDDFASMNLPQVAAQGVISRSSDVLKEHYNALAAQDENARLTNLRAIMLDLLTQQPLVRAYGAALGPSEYIRAYANGIAYSDATNLSTPATLVAELPGPYSIVEANQFIRLAIDGAASYEYPLPLGQIASITGTVTEPFTIVDDLILPSNNKVRVLFDDPNASSPYTVDFTLTAGPSRSSAAIAAEVNAELVGTDLKCTRSFSPLKFDSLVTVTSLGGLGARFSILGGSLLGLGIVVGDELDVVTGPDAGTTWVVQAVDPAGNYVEALGVGAVTPVALPDDIEVKVGPAKRALTLEDTNPTLSLYLRRTIRIMNDAGNIYNQGAATLGWFPGMESRSRPVAAKDVAANLSTSRSDITAAAVFSAVHYTGSAHSSASDAGLVVLSKYQAEGTLDGGTLAIFSVSDGSDPSAHVGLGDQCVIRSTATSADLNAQGSVTNVSSTSMAVFFSRSVSPGAVSIEVGPQVNFAFGAILNVTDGNNKGRYAVRENQGIGTTCLFEIPIESALPVPKDGSSNVNFSVEFGVEYLSISSRLEQVTSEVQAANASSGTGAEYFFHAANLPASAIGTTSYLQFVPTSSGRPSWPEGIEAGDLILVFATDISVLNSTFTVVDASNSNRTNVIKLTPDIEANAIYAFSPNTNPPLALIRVAKVANYSTLKAALDAWTTADTQQTQYFRDLSRYLNPVLLNAKPTAVEIGNAVQQLTLLQGGVTALADDLSVYASPTEPAVDALLGSFRDKGSDRAIDLLLNGQFSAFFGLDMESTSYSGTLTKAARELAVNDLPVRKTARTALAGQTSLGVIPDQKDFEYTSDDADSPDTPDIPVGADTSTGTSY